MTMTDLSTDRLAEAVVAAAQAATRALPATAGWLVEPADPAAAAPVPADGRAVVADLGALGRLVLVAGPALARAVQVGPPPAEDLLEGVQTALERATESLGEETGVPVALDATVEADPATTVVPGPGEVAVVALLLDGDDHAATLVVVAPAPAEPDDADSGPASHEFAAIDTPASRSAAGGPLELLHDVEMGLTAELGRTRMLVRDILDLSPGSVIELDRAAGAPVDVLVNGTLIARGEVVVIDEEFGIRVTEVVGYDDPHGKLRR